METFLLESLLYISLWWIVGVIIFLGIVGAITGLNLSPTINVLIMFLLASLINYYIIIEGPERAKPLMRGAKPLTSHQLIQRHLESKE